MWKFLGSSRTEFRNKYSYFYLLLGSRNCETAAVEKGEKKGKERKRDENDVKALFMSRQEKANHLQLPRVPALSHAPFPTLVPSPGNVTTIRWRDNKFRSFVSRLYSAFIISPRFLSIAADHPPPVHPPLPLSLAGNRWRARLRSSNVAALPAEVSASRGL